MAQTGRTKLVVIFIALLVGCNHRVNKVSIEGDFVAISTAVFLTDGEEEKADQFNKCVSGKYSIQANKLYADSACILFDSVKDITITDSFQTTVDLLPVRHSTKLSYFIDYRVDSHDSIWVFKAQEVFLNGTSNSLFIVKKTIDTLILARDPFFLKLVKVNSNSSPAK